MASALSFEQPYCLQSSSFPSLMLVKLSRAAPRRAASTSLVAAHPKSRTRDGTICVPIECCARGDVKRLTGNSSTPAVTWIVGSDVVTALFCLKTLDGHGARASTRDNAP